MPWIAEADLLLSDLCNEIGKDMYAIKLPVRNYLLREMEERFGHERMAEVANVLLSYVHRVAHEEDTLPQDELQAERWAAMAYIDGTRDKVVEELVDAFWECVLIEEGAVKSVNWSEMQRLLTIVEEITPQLGAYPELLKYAELTGRVIADYTGEETLQMLREDLLTQELFVNGRALPRLDSLISRKRYESVSAAAIVHNESWKIIEEAFFMGTPVKGQVVGNNRGGLLVDVGGILTFLPTQHIDIRPVSNLSAFRNHDLEALVLDASLERSEVVLSRRALIAETEQVAFDKALEHLQEGMTIEGTIVKLTKYGAFVNFGGEIDGLLHISEMSWGYVPDANWLFKVDERIEALVKKIDRETRSIHLSYKELIPNPWLTVPERYSRGMQVKATVVSNSETWLFVQLEPHVVGRVGLWEFAKPGETPSTEAPALPQRGDEIDLWIIEIDVDLARVALSLKEQLDEAYASDIALASEWDELENAFEKRLNVKATVLERVKGGLILDVNGIRAFLPGSQLDVRHVSDFDAFVGQEIEGRILELSRKPPNVIISRRLALEEEQAEKRQQILQQIEEGMLFKGRITNLTEYGAFIDIGGVYGLLHVTDMTWGRQQDPNELFKVGDEIHVKVLKVDLERQRLTFGYKQLQPDPWTSAEELFPAGTRVTGRVAVVADFGAFVDLGNGIEGLIHVSEMRWGKRPKHANEVFSRGDVVEAVVLSVDGPAHRMSLGMKQLQSHPWQTVSERYPLGMHVRGRVRSLTDLGAFIEIDDDIPAFVKVSDISSARTITHPKEVLKKGQEVEAVVTALDHEHGRLLLSIQLLPSSWDTFTSKHKAGDVVRGTVTRFAHFGAFVELDADLEGLCHISELSDTPDLKPEDVVQIGQQLDFKILRIDPETSRIALSLRALGKDEPLPPSTEAGSNDIT